MTPGPLIREARQRAGLTQSQLASRLGIAQPAVARLERADANPTFTTLADALAATGHSLVLRRRPGGSGVDEAQIIERLKLTPSERVETFLASHRNLARVLANTRRLSGSPS